jgi:hypothetical protein
VQLTPGVRQASSCYTVFAPVPPRLLNGMGKRNKITLRAPGLCRPCDFDPMNADSRLLGVAVHQIGLVPRSDPLAI